MTTKSRKRVVILGAGSGGLTAALELERIFATGSGLEITLVNQRNYHLFPPLLYQVVAGGIEPGHICFPVRSLLKHGGTMSPVTFRESQVEAIDLDRKMVATDNGELQWDYLVVALGSTTNFFNLTEMGGNAFPLKTMRDSIAIHNHILDSYETALLEPDDERQRELLTFIIVGGGATGVELVSAIQEFTSKVLPRNYPSIAPEKVRVVLVEARDSVLHDMNHRLRKVALHHLRAQGVEVLLKTRISRLWSSGIQTEDGRTISSRTVIWVAGVKPVSLVENLPLDKARDGRVIVDPYFSTPALPEVYIIGDCAYLQREPRAETFPPTGQMAVRGGLACARNIARVIRGKPQEPFRYKYKGELISMGRNAAVAQIGRYAFDGFPAWLVWRIYYLAKVMAFKNRLNIALDWSFAYFYQQNTAHLE